MKKRKFLCLLLAFLLLLQQVPILAFAEEEASSEESGELMDDNADESIPAPPELDCKGVILIELNSGTTVYESHADDRLYPASLTKVMTCLLALEKGNLTDEVTVDGALLKGLDADASIAGLSPGDRLTLEELLYCVMVPSANDASLVVANHIAGSVDAFVDMMNEKAKALGCTNTHFVNPDGLHDEDHYTSARDLSIITKAALESDIFRTICGTAVYELTSEATTAEPVLYTTNYFLSTIITPQYYWEKASGVKTGFTTPAGRCLITLVEENGFSYLCVILGAQTAYNANNEAVFGSFTQSRALIEYALENFRFVSVFSHLSPIAQVPVTSGEVKYVIVAPTQDVSALLPAKYDEKKIDISYSLTDGDSLAAPIAADQEVGTAKVTYEGKEVGQVALRAITAVERNKMLSAPTQEDPGFLRLISIIIIVVALLLLAAVSMNRRRRYRRNKKRRKK